MCQSTGGRNATLWWASHLGGHASTSYCTTPFHPPTSTCCTLSSTIDVRASRTNASGPLLPLAFRPGLPPMFPGGLSRSNPNRLPFLRPINTSFGSTGEESARNETTHFLARRFEDAARAIPERMAKTIGEPKCLNAVAQFHRLFRVPVEPWPCVPDAKRAALRVALIQEELDELRQAIQNNDVVEAADALADLQYVVSGAVLEFGMADKFKDVFEEVHRSNMSKACETEEIAQATVEHYVKLEQPCSYQKVDGEWLVYRDSDNKVLKSVHYSPADIQGTLESGKENETI